MTNFVFQKNGDLVCHDDAFYNVSTIVV